MDFVVDRRTWVRGLAGGSSGLGQTALLNDQGNMCCLGHCMTNLGAEKNQILGLGEPEEIDNDPYGVGYNLVRYPFTAPFANYNEERGRYVNNELSTDAMVINDALIDEEAREQQLIELFMRHGHTIRFEN